MIRRAKRQANKSTYRYRMGAVVFRKKKVISEGYNIPYTHIHPAELPMKYRKFPTSLHAEVAALLAANEDVKGASLIVVRINWHNQFLDSFPCPYCLMYLKHVGIRKIYYSTPDGIMEHFL